MEADLYEGTGDGHLIRAGVGGGEVDINSEFKVNGMDEWDF